MSLDPYRRKRDPDSTPEPFPEGEQGSRQPIFVVQRHDARRLHYDLRLERDGALASWAVPKGVPLDPAARALAVHVEDHPLAYARFAGEIPAGQYGAGTVEIWDDGTYELLEEKPSGQLTFRLHGSRLQGVWSLVPAHLDGKERNWLLVRHHDDGAPPAGAEPGYRPMLATLDAHVPHGDWVFEVKLDGYRALAYLRGGDCRLVSRNGNDRTERFAGVARELPKAAKSPDAVLDGEICRLDERGRSSFSELQQGTGPLVYYAFDLLELDGASRLDEPLVERREALRALLDDRNRTVRFSEGFDDGDALLHAAADQGLEGIMAKRARSPYRPGKRTRDWLKLKTHGRQELVVVGYTRGSGRRADTFGALVLAVTDDGGLRWAGNVGTGFGDAEIARLLALLRPLRRDTSPLRDVPTMPRVRKGYVQWVEPRLVAEIELSGWTHDGRVRHPSYKGIRDDKRPVEVVREEPETIRRGTRTLSLSNLDKVFWPEGPVTKGDLLAYYRQVAPVLVPHLKDRPFTMRRYPDGAYGKSFFQKDAPKHMPEWIRTHRALVSPRERSRERRWLDLPLVNDELALLWMVNMGCIDMNPWLSRVDRPDRPDVVLFDLDPTPDTPWSQTIEVALMLRELLDGLGLRSFPKTSGGKGLHVLVPISRRATYEASRSFAEVVADALVRARPRLATTQWSKATRRGVLIDAGQNGEGKTIASAYSVRPHPGVPVSTPLAWDEVAAEATPASFTMEVVLERVARLGDLHADVLTTRQSLAKALSAVG